MNEIPFPKITLSPCIPKGDMHFLDELPNGVCNSYIKRTFIEHFDAIYTARRPTFPKEPKEFYIVPIRSLREAKVDYKLKWADFAVLWLPNVAWKADEIRGIVPDDLMQSPIIAIDNLYSRFRSFLFLAVDLSMGSQTYVFWRDEHYGFGFAPDCQCLMEINESADSD